MATDDPIPTRTEIHLFATREPRRGLFRLFPPATRAELWAGLAFFVLSLLGAAWVIKCRSEALALEQDSVNVEGKVVRLWKAQNHAGWYYRVEYDYFARPEVDRHVFRNTTELPKEYFDRLKEGGPIAVKVCRTDPANHQVVGERPRVFSSNVAVLFNLVLLALLAGAGVINLCWWWISHRKLGSAAAFALDVKSVAKDVRIMQDGAAVKLGDLKREGHATLQLSPDQQR